MIIVYGNMVKILNLLLKNRVLRFFVAALAPFRLPFETGLIIILIAFLSVLARCPIDHLVVELIVQILATFPKFWKL